MELYERIKKFCEKVNEVKAENNKKSGFTGWKDVAIFDFLSDKWCRVVSQRIDGDGLVNGQTVYAFIALKDFGNKTLGQIKAGDIHKPASWNGPAKHARGSVFKDDFGNCIQPYSVVYLK